MPSDDLESHARSAQDYYALLEVAEGATESEIRKAYRRTALKYHPDKNAGDAAAVEKFHLLSVANDVLSDPHAKAIYDSGRQARREKELRERAYGDERRRMKEDLERKERGGKRTREEDEEYENQQAELRRLQADGARRRYERQEKLRKQQEEELKAAEAEDMEIDSEPANVPEMERAVRIKWDREGGGKNVGKDELSTMFERFGKIDMVVVLKDKTKTKKNLDTKRIIGSATVVFVSMASAHAAVEDSASLQFPSLDSVTWAKGEEPQVIQNLRMGKIKSPKLDTTRSMDSIITETASRPSREDVTRIRLRLAAQRRKAGRGEDATCEVSEPSPLAPQYGGSTAQQTRRIGTDEREEDGLRRMPSFGSFKLGSITPQKSPAQATPKPAYRRMAEMEGEEGGGLRKVPSFASFKPHMTPKASSTNSPFASPALDQARKHRAREEERRRLVEELRQEEAEEA